MRVVILGNGEIKDYQFVKSKINSDDYIICCDGGVRHSFELRITPSLILGDLDSADPSILTHYKQLNVPIEKYPVEKDFTDMELCMRRAIELKAKEVYVFGAIGNRLDHMLGNVHALVYALKNNVTAYMIDENNTACVIDREIALHGAEGGIISLIPLTTSVTGVKTSDLRYPLNHETLTIGSSRGISNMFSSDSAKVSIESGYLLVIQTRD